jgi:hypothetical protein
VALVAALALQPLALIQEGPLVQALWLVTVGLLAARALLLLVISYRRRDALWLRWKLAAVSLLLPAVLLQNVTVLASADSNLLGHAGLAYALAVIGMTLAVALWGGWFYQPGTAVREAARMGFWFSATAMLTALPLALALDPVVLSGRSVWAASWPLAAGAVLAVPCLMQPVRWRYFAASAVLAAGFGLALLELVMPRLG